MKNKILDLIWNRYSSYFEKFIVHEKPDLEKIFNENKHYFELLLVKDFVGFIPKDIQEPALNIFKEGGEQFERWTLWQSWYINRKAINDPIKITFYNGMMVYLKVLNTLARVNKKNYQPTENKVVEESVASSWVDDALADVKGFQEGLQKLKDNRVEE